MGGAQLAKYTFFAPLSLAILTISRLVVPRTMLSSTNKTFFPINLSSIAVSFRLTPCCLARELLMMKVRWTYLLWLISILRGRNTYTGGVYFTLTDF